MLIKCIIIIIIIIILITLLIIHENTTLRTTSYYIKDEKIKDFNNYKIGLISDFHNIRSKKLIKKLIETIKKSNLDIIVITGDILNSRFPNEQITLNFIKEILKIKTTYYVRGNHEKRIKKYLDFEKKLKSLGLKVLDNKKETLKRKDTKIDLIGINDFSYFKNKKEYRRELKVLTQNHRNYQILLAHRPEFYKEYVKCNVELTLSGHTHAGQIRMPFIGAIIAPTQGWFPKYSYGLYESGNSKMVISAGIGCSIIPIRTFNKPEFVIINLNNKE